VSAYFVNEYMDMDIDRLCFITMTDIIGDLFTSNSVHWDSTDCVCGLTSKDVQLKQKNELIRRRLNMLS